MRWGTTEWNVVGIFEDGGSVAESEVWTDASVLQGVYNRGNSYQSMRVQAHERRRRASLQGHDDRPTRDSMSECSPRRSTTSEQSQILQTLVRTIGVTIAVLMGLGAIFAALNTMYSAVSARTREIATLRALGFGSSPVVVSVLAEALLLGIVGGAIGMLISYFAFNGMRASTMNFCDVQPDHVRVHCDAADPRDRPDLRARARLHRRPAAERARRAPADHDGTQRAVGRASARL